MPDVRRRRAWPFTTWGLGALVSVFLVRLAFGVASDFWAEDEFQIYLIGLQYYATGVWPLYGPDVVYTQTQVPGALQGLLVGGPFWVLPQPESPYVLLNLLSLGALGLLGWYIARRVPGVPRWFLWSWMFFSPWTFYVSTHVINTSYVLIGAVIFVVSALEVVPQLRTGAFDRRLAYLGLGFGLLWVYQVHLSAAVLALFACLAVVLAAREDWRDALRGVGWASAGAVVAGSTVVPTVIAAGPIGVLGRTGANMAFEPGHLLRVPEVFIQALSLATFEVPRFLGPGTTDRLEFLARYGWAAPFVVCATILGILQAAVLIVGLGYRPTEQAAWVAVRRATTLVLAVVAASFVFSIKEPASHAFYIVMPLVTIYAFYWWAWLLGFRAGRVLAVVLLLSGLVTHVAVAARNFTDRSLYTDRARVVQAIEARDYRVLGERRTDWWEADSDARE